MQGDDDTNEVLGAVPMDGTFREIERAIDAVDIWTGAWVGSLKPVPEGVYRLPREQR